MELIGRFQDEFGFRRHKDDFIFRGMENSAWKLLPSIYRNFPAPVLGKIYPDSSFVGNIYVQDENEIICHFIKEAAGFLPQISTDDYFTWLQYAQHFGVPTRLLDFTTSPLTALYFCCHSESSDEGAVWILNVNNYSPRVYEDFNCVPSKQLEMTRKGTIDHILKFQIIKPTESSNEIVKIVIGIILMMKLHDYKSHFFCFLRPRF